MALPRPDRCPGQPDPSKSAGTPRLGEFERIARYLRPLAADCPGALALTDDAAVLDVPPEHELVVTTDAMVAGIHFLPDDPPGDIAAKLLRTNLSDLAAMGAVPFGYSLVLALPRESNRPGGTDAWLAAFAAGLAADQTRFGVPLTGGDSVATRGPITLAITALGLVPRGQALTRRVRGTIAEQAVFVSGTIGDAALGLKLVLGEADADSETTAALVARLRRPEPRLALGAALRGVAHAVTDVSDGLLADLGHICEVTGCAARIESALVPVSAPARTLLAHRPDLFPSLLTGGDDYELVFTAPFECRPTLAALAARHGVAITEIGRLESAGPPGTITIADADGQIRTPTIRGWNHFTERG